MCLHIWYLDLSCGFEENFPAITWHGRHSWQNLFLTFRNCREIPGRVFLFLSVIIFSSSNLRKNMIYHIFCLIKKLCKVPKFAKFMLVISLFKYSRKNFLDRFLNLPREMTCLQNILFNIDFLIYFEILEFSNISIDGTSPYCLG